MITGYNTDIDHGGRVFHVQTEDRGAGNPIIETLIYTGGEIIAQRQTPYGELLATGNCSDADVQRLLEKQHKGTIRDIYNGKFDTQGPKPFGHNIISDRSLDEVVLGYLGDNLPAERMTLEWETPPEVREGAVADLNMRVIEANSERPYAGAEITVRLVATDGRRAELWHGTSDADGRLVARFEIPALPNANGAVFCTARMGERTAELREVVRPATAAPAGSAPAGSAHDA